MSTTCENCTSWLQDTELWIFFDFPFCCHTTLVNFNGSMQLGNSITTFESIHFAFPFLSFGAFYSPFLISSHSVRFFSNNANFIKQILPSQQQNCDVKILSKNMRQKLPSSFSVSWGTTDAPKPNSIASFLPV